MNRELEEAIETRQNILDRISQRKEFLKNHMKDYEKYEKLEKLYEKCFRELINNEIITVYDLWPGKSFLDDLFEFAKIQVEISDVCSKKIFSEKAQLYIAAIFYAHDYEFTFRALRNIALKINDFHRKKDGCQITSKENIEKSTNECLKVFKTHSEDFKEIFEDFDHDIRGSVAHAKYRYLEEADQIYFSIAKAGFSKEELYKKASFVSLVFQIMLYVNAKLEKEALENLLKNS